MEDYPEYIIGERISGEGEKWYYVKWVGCDLEDNTWETEEKMKVEWPAALKKYKKDVENRTLKRYQIPKQNPLLEETVFNYTNSVKDWELEISSIDYVEKSKIPGLIVYIQWKNGLKSVHHSSEVYMKCPQKMIEYFEQFAKFNEIFDED
ncbi:MAG: hypothetical protein EXX96DRAFT_545555 [Benjaminiella poitrasii]|nr:MAG: hypothetical protein EXX96DRAFT_545555 [Benjaminiella poitrasii]